MVTAAPWLVSPMRFVATVRHSRSLKPATMATKMLVVTAMAIIPNVMKMALIVQMVIIVLQIGVMNVSYVVLMELGV